MNINTIHNVFFIGIGGIGMSALARYFKYLGKNVAGYDKTLTSLTKELQENGINVSDFDSESAIPEAFTNNTNTLVIYTPAIPKTNSIYNYFISNGYTIKKRAEVLGLITESTTCLAVAGTHGKTTTSSILAHLLFENKVSFTAFLGGIAENFNSNLVINGNAYTVVEADEFDRSFLHLSPNIACITSTDADHLDIYKTHEQLETAFKEFAGKVPKQGKLLVKSGLPFNGITYGIEDNSDYNITGIEVINGEYEFTINTPTEQVKKVRFSKPGRHNLLNALAAFAMAHQLSIPTSNLASALATFKGVQRRFSYHIKSDDVVFIDDYAHHPTEINALHQAVREMYPDKKVLAIFQPHLFSRTKDFADEFAKSLEKFDEIVLLDIYPAREKPIPGVTSKWLAEKIKNKSVAVVSKTDLIDYVNQTNANVILTIGAGDIAEQVPIIKKALQS